MVSENYTSFKIVEDTNLMLSVPPLIEESNASKVDNIKINNECYEMAVSVIPFNDIGNGRLATNKRIFVTKNGNFLNKNKLIE